MYCVCDHSAQSYCWMLQCTAVFNKDFVISLQHMYINNCTMKYTDLSCPVTARAAQATDQLTLSSPPGHRPVDSVLTSRPQTS